MKNSNKNKLDSRCKDCCKKYSEENKERIKEYKSKKYYEIKDTPEYKQKRYDYYQENKDIKIEKNKNYNQENKDQISKQKKEYYLKNKEEISEKRKEYFQKIKNDPEFKSKKRDITREWRRENKDLVNQRIKDKKINDPLYKLTDIIRTLIWISIKKKGFKKDSKTSQILGCTFEEFKIHIENQFQDGMTWENQGEWHLDHKIPISWADSEQKVYELNHYLNFQPLWKEDNLKKGNRWIDL